MKNISPHPRSPEYLKFKLKDGALFRTTAAHRFRGFNW